MELAPRDVVARSIQTEIDEGRGIDGKAFVHLDLRHLGQQLIEERLPGIRDLCIHFAGVDPVTALIPVQPGQHYSMGGIDTDTDGATQLAGSLRRRRMRLRLGARRQPPGRQLTPRDAGVRPPRRPCGSGGGRAERRSTAVRPDLVCAAARDCERRVSQLIARDATETVGDLRARVTGVMDAHVQVFRNQTALASAVSELRDLRERCAAIRVRSSSLLFNVDLVRTLELFAMVEMALAGAQGALAAGESRGAHARTDARAATTRTG